MVGPKRRDTLEVAWRGLVSLRRLATLVLGWFPLEVFDVEELAQLPQLTCLKLQYCNVGNGGVAVLARSPGSSTLGNLEVSDIRGLSTTGVEHLTRSHGCTDSGS